MPGLPGLSGPTGVLRRIGVPTLAAAVALAGLTVASAPSSSGATAAAALPAAAGAPAAWQKARKMAVIYKQQGRVVAQGPNPALSLVGRPQDRDIAGWARTAAARAAAAAAARAARRTAPATRRLTVTEREAAGQRGVNDSRGTAQNIAAFGTRAGAYPAADLTGNLSPGAEPAVENLPPNTENDDTPETAGVTGVSTVRGGFATTGFLGDAIPTPEFPDPAADLDAYALDLQAGELVTARLSRTSGNLEPLIYMISEQGRFIADSFSSPDPFNPEFTAVAPATGRYFVLAFGFAIFDVDTGEVIQTTGDYSIRFTARDGDLDFYRVNLAAGDVLGVNVGGSAALVSLYSDDGQLVMSSGQDVTFIFPATTPLPGGGNAVADTVAPRAGRFYVAITGGDGPYTGQIEAYRPGGTSAVQQTIFLDFDGQRLNTGIFGGRGVTTLSPLSSFMSRWGIPASQRAALGAAIKATTVESVRADLRASGLSNSVAVRIVTSDEVRDPFGNTAVTRVIVGGTIEESGVGTIGIAQTIDPGNFAREESALVLLDLLSDPADPDLAPYSLNTYLTPQSNRVRFVGQAVGNIVAHEIGHVIGNWHTDNSNAEANLMDAGGVFGNLFGVGPDNIGGTADDVDVDYGPDTFDLFEGFGGTENTLARSTWGLSR